MRLLLVISLICASSFVISCNSTGATQLGGDFRSYETISDVRNQLKKAGVSDLWEEKHEGPPKPDPRPHYELTTMSGPFTLLGIKGHLEMVFYNGQLTSSQFSVPSGYVFLTSMREQHSIVPAKAGDEITVYRRTKFRYYIDPDGTYRFIWTDPKLEKEWLNWIGKYS
jgi:hypothetical protein